MLRGPAVSVRPELDGPLVAVSYEAVVQLIALRHPRWRLGSDELRDIKLVALLVEIDSGHLSGKLHVGDGSFRYDDPSSKRIAATGGISQERVTAAIGRLLEAGVMLAVDGADPGLVFSERVLRPAGAAEYVDWHSVAARLFGRTTALLILRSALDLMRLPWQWVSLTY
jgi:hypothetical protein